jgi:predicted CopG family antitoxin
MSETKQIRVSGLVHSDLSKRKKDDETFDDVLRRVLDLQPDLDSILSYYSDEQQEIAQQMIDEIDAVGDFHQSIKTEGTVEVLEFEAIGSRRVIASIEFDEKPSKSEITVSYRNQKGDMETIGSVRQKQGEELTGGILGEKGMFDDPMELVEVARRRAKDANNAWG